MRRLTITWKTIGATPILVAATLLPASSSCSSNTTIGAGGSGGTGGNSQSQSSSSASSSSAGGGGGGFNPVGSSSSTGGAGPCENPSDVPIDFTVDVPAPGTPADPGQICALMAEPVTSNTAATITLTPDPQDIQLATGFVSVDNALAADVVGTPTITLTGMFAISGAINVTNVTPIAGGYSFDAQFVQALTSSPSFSWQVQATASFELQCNTPSDPTRTVEANTIIHLCFDDTYENLHWVSSGGVCNVCEIIAEMAPSPIVADTTGDDLPLADALRLRLRLLAKVGNAVVLLAENDGGDGMHYQWQPSSGEIEQLAPDVVLWRLDGDSPETEALLQVAAHNDEGAAIAMYEWELAA